MSLRPGGRRRIFPRLSGRRRVFPRAAFRRLSQPSSLVGLVVLLLLMVWFVWGQSWRQQGPDQPSSSSSFSQVWRVIDGDTLELVDGTRVRLIGVDAPEVGRAGQPPEPFSREATQFTEQFLASGAVRFEDDPQDRQDRYGRRLAYVWVGDRMLNEELLRAGLARARLEFHYSEAMKLRFSFAEQQARQARRGLWSLTP